MKSSPIRARRLNQERAILTFIAMLVLLAVLASIILAIVNIAAREYPILPLHY